MPSWAHFHHFFLVCVCVGEGMVSVSQSLQPFRRFLATEENQHSPYPDRTAEVPQTPNGANEF